MIIKDIFIPSTIGSFVVGNKVIIGCEVNQLELRAAKVKASGNKRTIESYYEVSINQDMAQPFADRLSRAISELRDQIGSFDQFNLVLPGSIVIFKEITVPFTDYDNIKKVAPFEVEQQLPFPVQDAYLDAIIIETKEGKSRVLVALCKREYFEEYIRPFYNNNITVNRVTVDMIEWMGFVKAIPEYAQQKEPYALIEIDLHATRIILIEDNKILGSRYLSKGIRDIVTLMDQEQEASIDYFMRYGFKEERIKQAASSFVEDLRFTLNAFAKQHQVRLSKVFVAGVAQETVDIIDYLSAQLEIPVEKFYSHKIIHNGTIGTQNQQGIPGGYEVSLAAALMLDDTYLFNIAWMVENPKEERIVYFQFIAAAVLTGAILVSLFLYSFFTIRSLKKEATQSEIEAIDKLKRAFALRKTPSTLETALTAAKQELAKEQSIWFALSTNNRFSYLTYLQELFARIDSDGLGLDLKKLTIKSSDTGNEDIMTLEGSVANYDALRAFEEALTQSKLFKTVPKLQETKFNITLFLIKDYEQ